jgi:glucose/arabinose dehydrogenase
MQLNHGIELSPDNTILYASSQEAVYAWAYNSETGEVFGDARRVINLGGDGSHSTRTLLLPPSDPDFLLVSWGSDGNVDPQARDPTSGYSTVKAFNISDTSRVWDYASEGLLVGYGLRNSVGLAQNPVTGGLFSNENSIDNLARDGVEIVEDNPAEELVSEVEGIALRYR